MSKNSKGISSLKSSGVRLKVDTKRHDAQFFTRESDEHKINNEIMKMSFLNIFCSDHHVIVGPSRSCLRFRKETSDEGRKLR